MSDSRRYVAATRDRRKPPRNRKRWYRCPCGLWWGINKSCLCTCGRRPPTLGGPEPEPLPADQLRSELAAVCERKRASYPLMPPRRYW